MYQSPGPLSVGNVVSAGLRLYRDRFKSYFDISLVACLWVLLSVLVSVVLDLIRNYDEFALISLLLIPIQFIFNLYCTAKSLTNAAIISRLAFAELLNKPESVVAIRQQFKSKIWLFWLTQFLTGLALMAVILGLLIILFIGFFLLATIIKNSAIAGIIMLALYLGLIIAYFWFYARLFIPEVPLVIEDGMNSSGAISRSWQLTKGFAWRITLIITVAILVTSPIYLLAGVPMIMTFISATSSVGYNGVSSATDLAGISLGFLISIVIFILLNIVALPFWQIIKAVIYYDLRSRREGLGLELEDSGPQF